MYISIYNNSKYQVVSTSAGGMLSREREHVMRYSQSHAGTVFHRFPSVSNPFNIRFSPFFRFSETVQKVKRYFN